MFTAACRATSLDRPVNAERLCELANEFRLEGLGHKARVRVCLKILEQWGLIRWENPKRLRRGYSRLRVAGINYPWPELPEDYLRNHATHTRQKRRAQPKEQKRPSRRASLTPDDPRHADRWDRHGARITELWTQAAGEEVRKHVHPTWLHVAALMERKGFDSLEATRYLAAQAALLTRDPSSFRGAFCKLRVCKTPQRVQRYIEKNRAQMKALQS